MHFAEVGNGALARELEPRALLFRDAKDAKKSMQYLWVSTPGVRTPLPCLIPQEEGVARSPSGARDRP